jgi:hypothetical protein
MTTYHYPPLPAESYYYSVEGMCAVRKIQPSPKFQAILNLLWLSVPALDALAVPHEGIWKSNFKVVMVLQTVINDLPDDEELVHMVVRHPEEFIEWWTADDHASLLECYGALGGESWYERVLARAKQAADRMKYKLVPANNVVYASFGKLAQAEKA